MVWYTSRSNLLLLILPLVLIAGCTSPSTTGQIASDTKVITYYACSDGSIVFDSGKCQPVKQSISEPQDTPSINVSVDFKISDVDTSWFYGSGYISRVKYIIENTGNAE